MTKTYIPEEVVYGVKEDNVAMSKLLGFATYRDDKGNLRKEKTFMSWINQSLGVKSFKNKPRSGFIINRHIDHYAYDFGNDRVRFRVYCPEDDGFEFEITPLNLSYIMSVSDIVKREIVGECVFAWQDNELMLLPVNSKHYKEAVENTNRRNDFKDIKKEQKPEEVFKFGNILQTKTGNFYLYLGKRKFVTYKEFEKIVKCLSPENYSLQEEKLMFHYDLEEIDLAIPLKEKACGDEVCTYIYNNPYSYVRINKSSYMLSERDFASFKVKQSLESIKSVFELDSSWTDCETELMNLRENLPNKNRVVINMTENLQFKKKSSIPGYSYVANKFINLPNLDFDGKKKFSINFIPEKNKFVQVKGVAKKNSDVENAFDIEVFINHKLETTFTGTFGDFIKEVFPQLQEPVQVGVFVGTGYIQSDLISLPQVVS